MLHLSQVPRDMEAAPWSMQLIIRVGNVAINSCTQSTFFVSSLLNCHYFPAFAEMIIGTLEK